MVLIYNNRRHCSVTRRKGVQRDQPLRPLSFPRESSEPLCSFSLLARLSDVNTWCSYLLARQSRQQGSLQTAKKQTKKTPWILSTFNTKRKIKRCSQKSTIVLVPSFWATRGLIVYFSKHILKPPLNVKLLHSHRAQTTKWNFGALTCTTHYNCPHPKWLLSYV